VRTTALAQAIRVAAAVFGALAFVAGLLAVLGGVWQFAVWPLILGTVLLLVALYERTRYEAGERAEGATAAKPEGLQRTEELFNDPTTGDLTRVWYDPQTGERRYLPEP
jgi:fatty acid desaturase